MVRGVQPNYKPLGVQPNYFPLGVQPNYELRQRIFGSACGKWHN
jgi:hypothetical protein